MLLKEMKMNMFCKFSQFKSTKNFTNGPINSIISLCTLFKCDKHMGTKTVWIFYCCMNMMAINIRNWQSRQNQFTCFMICVFGWRMCLLDFFKRLINHGIGTNWLYSGELRCNLSIYTAKLVTCWFIYIFYLFVLKLSKFYCNSILIFAMWSILRKFLYIIIECNLSRNT